MHPLKKIIKYRAMGETMGCFSVCSANEWVLRAAMRRCKDIHLPLVIEATANQVNQDGGYTGMRPSDFVSFVSKIAMDEGYPSEKLILGGDHLGPLVWAGEDAIVAMEKAAELIRLFVDAGFTKIHIDTSMRLGGDDPGGPDPCIIAKRGAMLAKVCEETYSKRKTPGIRPVYVIGSEVPVPGGSKGEKNLAVTDVSHFEGTLNLFQDEMQKAGIPFDQVVAVVVQPGVEFDDRSVHDYDRAAAKELCDALKKRKDIVFEGHSTDYQTAPSLKQMVEDGIAILKVGPALTFALREGLFALEMMERELIGEESVLSHFRTRLEEVMIKDDRYWKGYYPENAKDEKIGRLFGYSDRCRYYLPNRKVRSSMNKLLNNIENNPIPLSMLSQYMPHQYRVIREKGICFDAKDLLLEQIGIVVDDYIHACIDDDS